MVSAAGAVSLESLRHRARRRFADWVSQRIPPSRTVTLNQKRLFIFPSRVGFFFGLCLLVMLLAAINFENNLSYALTFMLTTLFVLAILHTFANLSGLTIRAVRARPAFPGQQTEFELLVERSRKREHHAIYFRFQNSDTERLSVTGPELVSLRLLAQVGERGWHNPGRLLVETTYPLGLIRCWTWIDLDLQAMVYPRPLPSTELPGLATEHPDGASVPVEGTDDFYGFRDYRAGDSPRHLYWKGLARGQSLQTKQYTAYADRSVWLDWDAFPGVGTEQRLSCLCYWALEFDREGDEYGLRIPGVVIEPGLGEHHREQVLKALALHGKEPSR